MRLGVCYYPEQWPEARWATDAASMRAQGIDIVRIAEFAWARMEPVEGQYHWDWLDRAIDTLAAAGHEVVLGTPTAAPPAWLSRSYPDTLPVDDQGRRQNFGARRHYCPNAPRYRELTEKVVTAMADRYGPSPAVIGWQIDNEFGGGRAVHLGWHPTLEQARVLLARLAETCGVIRLAVSLDPGLLAYRRGDQTLLLNFSDTPQDAQLGPGENVSVPPMDLKIIDRH